MPLKPPPRNAVGEVEPHDNPEILNDDRIIRRISQELLVLDVKSGGKRVSSMAYRASSGPNSGMSVDLERSIMEAGVDPVLHVTTPKFIGSVWFETGRLRAEILKVGFDPTHENPHHGQVWGAFTKPKQRRLMAIARWFVEIPGVKLS